ncbi:MAG TPA: hypothetical protein VFT54_04395, partial [Acidimicrobiia bacterium]|nr:hypothetical protein [Acidimicrobiia bacterium]
MPLPSSVSLLIASARRHLLTAGLVRLLITFVGVAAAVSSVLVGIGRYVVLPWAEPTAAALIGLAVVGAIVTAVVRRATAPAAALAIDRRLGGYDRVSTALELSHQTE